MKKTFSLTNETMGIIVQIKSKNNELPKENCWGLSKKERGRELAGKHHVVSMVTRTNEEKRWRLAYVFFFTH